ncbi:MAG TPA: UDP-2,3-diacylglucosamine diphosphatase LpxI [Xanthobacteraceae bacterium]|nr:UDP-2,3-diacylglucosamine diphosphatase LpxI [Xanthobacteraceae bacterium]
MPATPTLPEAPGTGPLGIICGGGAFPLAVAEGARRRGRDVVLFPLRGFADADVSAWPHVWIPFAKVGRLIAELRRHGCRDIVFIGTLLRPRLRELRVDWQTLRALPRVLKLFRGGDDHLLSGLGRLFEEQGFRVLGAHEAAPEILVPPGLLGRHAPGAAQRADADRGAHALRTLGPLDIGQGVVVVNGHIVAVEAAEGTDLMLARVAELRRLGRIAAPPRTGVFVKLAKAGQDRRFDLPSLGPRTVQGVADAGLAGLAVEAGGVIVTDLPALVRAADAAGLFVLGIEAGNG